MSNLTIRDLSTQWVDTKRPYVKKSTMAAYLLLLHNHILPRFSTHTAVSEYDLQSFVLEKLNDGLSAKTVKDILIVFKMIFKFGVKYKLWSEIPPFEDIRYPTSFHSKKKIEVFSIQDYKKCVLYVKENFSFKNLGVLICLSTGMRIGEVCALKWSDFNLDDGTVEVQRTIQRIYTIDGDTKGTELIIDTPKTKNSQRVIPLSSDMLSIIKPLFKIVNKEMYVLSNDDKAIEPRTYRSYYHLLLDKIGLPRIKFHGLRHSFASQCIAANVDIKTVSTILGHSNITTTFSLYVHPTMEQKKAGIDKLFKSIKV